MWLRNDKPAVVLAPMEGVTDAPMRALLTETGGFSHCVAEFLRVSHEMLPARVYFRHVPELASGAVTPSGVPVQGQLLGGDPEMLALSARRFYELGIRAVDLNFGCPAPTVNRHDGGATLLKYPHRIRAIVEAVRKVLPPEVPVSAKMRLGWDTLDAIHETADRAAEGGAAWITIHGRTKVAGYSPPAHWEPIGQVRRRLTGIPVVANGDIWTLEDFRRCRDVTGCGHFMLGRSAVADPLLAGRVAADLRGGEAPRARIGAGPGDWLPWLQGLAARTEARPDRSLYLARRTKQWVRMAGNQRPLPWFDAIKTARTFEQIVNILS